MEVAHVCDCWKDLSIPEVMQTTSLVSASNFNIVSWVPTCIANDQNRHSRTRGFNKHILHFPGRSFTRQAPLCMTGGHETIVLYLLKWDCKSVQKAFQVINEQESCSTDS